MPEGSESFAYHACALYSGGSYRELARLKKNYGTFSEAKSNLPIPARLLEQAQTSFDSFHTQDGRLILEHDAEYPALLREISWAPFGLYLFGKLPPPDMTCLAVVGTRKTTPAGKETARSFSRTFAQKGVGIVSGLALGIDAAAHVGALEAKGYTLAVLATGVDHIYPRHHAGLAKQILEQGGGILSEYPPGSPAFPYRFLERNRIVSGISQGTFVIEAPERSGSLATARFALEQNRSVFVLPGSATHPNFAGSHNLIRNGAELVTDPAHILEALGLATVSAPAQVPKGENPDEEQILQALTGFTTPLDIDKIIELTNLETQVVTQTLGFLVLKNSVTETHGGYMIKN